MHITTHTAYFCKLINLDLAILQLLQIQQYTPACMLFVDVLAQQYRFSVRHRYKEASNAAVQVSTSHTGWYKKLPGTIPIWGDCMDKH